MATLSGYVNGYSGGNRALVVIKAGPNAGRFTYNDKLDGYVMKNLKPGPATVEASKDGYLPQSLDVVLVAGVTTSLSFSLAAAPTPSPTPTGATLTGRVTVNGGTPANATVTIRSGPNAGVGTSSDKLEGYVMRRLRPGPAIVEASKAGYPSLSKDVTLIDGQTIDLSFNLAADR